MYEFNITVIMVSCIVLFIMSMILALHDKKVVNVGVIIFGLIILVHFAYTMTNSSDTNTLYTSYNNIEMSLKAQYKERDLSEEDVKRTVLYQVPSIVKVSSVDITKENNKEFLIINLEINREVFDYKASKPIVLER